MQSVNKIAKELNLKNLPQDIVERAKVINLDKFEADNNRKINLMYLQDKQRAMYHGSVFNEMGVLESHFQDFKVATTEQKTNFRRARQITKRIIDGEKFKAVFTGSAGTGKTMLSVCVMNYVVQHTHMACLFVSVPKLIDWEKVRAGGTDEQRAINLEKRIKNADLVVWDDLGSETSMQAHSQTQATEFTQKVLFNLADSRHDKNDIFTTNNTSAELMRIYNPKLISRMMTKKPENLIQFSGEDQRLVQN